jgi:hypothetical protein
VLPADLFSAMRALPKSPATWKHLNADRSLKGVVDVLLGFCRTSNIGGLSRVPR